MIEVVLKSVFCVVVVWLWSTYQKRMTREKLTAAALAGLLADHKDHSDECADGETCPQTVARLAVELADETIKRLDKTS